MCRKTLLVLFLFHYLFSCGQIYVKDSFTSNAFPICFSRGTSSIIVSPDEELSVKKTVGLFAEDLFRVTHTRAEIYTSKKYKGKEVIVIGTIGKNPFIDKLISKGKIDVSAIKNGWEQYIIQTVEKPQQGVDKALIVVGSDKRGTAYGVLSISEAMGVSPYYWWADVPVRHLSEVYLSGSIISKKPSVKYRGIFINDEDWGLKPWSSNNFEKELGDIGPKTYSKVCELILRLRGNMLAPAMHSCTGAFYSHPESKLVADSFGIIITTSHCEPLLLNNAAKSEWDIKRDGDWNYATNKSTIQKKWNDRLDEASRFENLYTMAMRGLHDTGLRGNLPMNEKVNLLNQVIIDQRQMLCQHIGKNILDIPQIFVPYKETMDVYENGLKVPDDITLVWVDDNYGYMKRVSNPEEQKRNGRSGVYYHMSYLGSPHDYLWLNTTPPVLMYEELKKAYDTGADRYWLLNVGDIKPSELGMKTFFDLAWNINGYDCTKVNSHQSSFLTGIFGEEYSHSFQDILHQYYRLAWSRKPECMGWEYEWDDSAHTGLKDTEYSFENYSEAQQRLRDYDNISNSVKGVLDKLDPSFRPAFFEMLAYPVMASYQMNRKFLMAQLNHEQYKSNQYA
nr:glycosyl hydrolase 115 family protein [Prevotella sp.]